jgi:hypothetical protein
MKINLVHVTCFIAFILSGFQFKTEAPAQVDICISGATSAGVMAAYTAKKMGKSVMLIEPGNHLGGMTTGGLGYTDIGNKYAITGLSRDFYRRIGAHYGKFEQWIFEPHVAKRYLQQYLDEAGIKVVYQQRLAKVNKSGGVIQSIVLEKSDMPEAQTNQVIAAKVFLDCTYEGDLMAKSGVSYKVGREANADYKETINGVQLQKGHQLPDGIDPYKIPGKPESGLLWGIADGKLDTPGTGDSKVQAYNYRICLTSDPNNMIPISKPENYNPSQFELLVRLIQKQPEKKKLGDYFIWSRMPNNKTDINNRGGFSTDMIGMDYDYPEADYQTRAKIINDHEVYTKSLLYFFGHDPRVPQSIREEMLKWGYPNDEYTDSGNWSPQLYIREARRMVGNYVMTQANCESKEIVKDGVGMAAYTMDSHNCQRIVVNGMVKNEGNVEVGGFGPYPISYNCLVPKESECSNLLVPVCLSATHIAYGSIRMEPVFMVLAQSSAAAAVMAIDGKTSVQKIDITRLQQHLETNPLANGSAPEILVDDENTSQVTKQGDWAVEKKGGYGPSFIVADEHSKSARSVTFTPAITQTGTYNIYAYFPKIPKLAPEMALSVFDGKANKEVIVRESDIIVEGQTSGEWFHVGKYKLPEGTSSHVKIAAKGTTGALVADAVLFVPDFK